MHRKLLLLALTLALAANTAPGNRRCSIRSTGESACRPGAGRRSSSWCGPKVTRPSHGSRSSRRSETRTSSSTAALAPATTSNAAGAYIIGGKPPPGIPRGGFFIACTNYGNPVTKGTVPKPSVTITKETAVKCTLPVSPVTDVVFRKRGVADLYVHAGARLVAQGHVTKSSATLTVTSGHCTLIAPPRP